MTDEQLEKQISEEFEKWSRLKTLGDTYDVHKAYRNGAKDAWQAARLPLLKKIEELEKKNDQLKRFWEPVLKKFEADKFITAHNKIALDSLTEAFDIFCDNEKLQKENEELRASNQKRIIEHNATKERMYKENEELLHYKTMYQSIAGKANLQHLVKENEELREALDWATILLENLDYYEDNAKFYRTKFNLNKEN